MITTKKIAQGREDTIIRKFAQTTKWLMQDEEQVLYLLQ